MLIFESFYSLFVADFSTWFSLLAYRSQLGAKHKLTVQATARLEELIEELKNPY